MIILYCKYIFIYLLIKIDQLDPKISEIISKQNKFPLFGQDSTPNIRSICDLFSYKTIKLITDCFNTYSTVGVIKLAMIVIIVYLERSTQFEGNFGISHLWPEIYYRKAQLQLIEYHNWWRRISWNSWFNQLSKQANIVTCSICHGLILQRIWWIKSSIIT